jgi:integrase
VAPPVEAGQVQPCGISAQVSLSKIEKLIAVAKRGRYGQRDATLILVAYQHGLRATEVADLEWSQVEWGRSPALRQAGCSPHQGRRITHAARIAAEYGGAFRSAAGRSPPTPSTAL